MALCQDPEITYLNGLGYNVVAEPAAGLGPLEVLGQNTNGVLDLGPLSAVWTTSAPTPVIGPPLAAAGISGGKTANLSLSLGLNLLGSIVSAMGGQAPSLNAAYGKASSLQFALGNVTSLSVVLTDLGAYLASGDVNLGNPVVSPYFSDPSASLVVIHEVLQATSVTVTATSQTNASLTIDPGALSQAVGGSLSIQPAAGEPSGSSSSGLTYTGAIPLTFAFKALHIAYVNGAWQLEGDEINSSLGTLGAPAVASDSVGSVIKSGLLRLKRAIT